MAYDALAESVDLIASRRLVPVRRLSRRRRFAAMAVDVAGDVAASMFARRGVGCIWQEIHVLAWREGQWLRLGGGGGTSDEQLLADRPALLPSYLALGRDAVTGADPQVIALGGSGGSHDDRGEADRPYESGRWINYATVRVNAQVASVQASGRWLPVPWHGHVLLVWSELPPPRVVAHGENGQVLGEVVLPSTRE